MYNLYTKPKYYKNLNPLKLQVKKVKYELVYFFYDVVNF